MTIVDVRATNYVVNSYLRDVPVAFEHVLRSY